MGGVGPDGDPAQVAPAVPPVEGDTTHDESPREPLRLCGQRGDLAGGVVVALGVLVAGAGALWPNGDHLGPRPPRPAHTPPTESPEPFPAPEAVRCPGCGTGHHPAASSCQVCGAALRGPIQTGARPDPLGQPHR